MHSSNPVKHRQRGFLRAFLVALALGLCLSSSQRSLTHAAPPRELDIDPAALQPPPISVLESSTRTAHGLIFVAPKTTANPPPGQVGPEIIDDQGRPVWFYPVGDGFQATDFRVQHYRGAPVLTFWKGPTRGGVGHAEGTDYILDQSYRVIATVNAGNGYGADLHEFNLTPYGTALIVIYHQEPYDLSSVGGAASGQVFDGIVQEIDVASGRVLFEWHSLSHVDVDESRSPVPTDPNTVYDYFHINAAALDSDGNLLVSARNTSAIYKIDHRTGRVIHRLGGTKSDYALGTGAPFAWQHNPLPDGFNTIRFFDNEASPNVDPPSKVKWLRIDNWNKTATLVRSIVHPDGLIAGSQGNSQHLDNADTFVGWGALGRFSEFDSNGTLLFDAQVPTGYDTYRAYRDRWHGFPTTQPTVIATGGSEGTTTVHVIWNGATEVTRWLVLGGSTPGALTRIADGAWNGLDTTITLGSTPKYVALVALNAWGLPLGHSDVTPVD